MAGMNEAPSGERVHIAFFGRRNAGKSSLMNAFTGQELSVVSPSKGTTTDAVYKAMELLPVGPVLLIDTPGLDDTGELGEKRTAKAKEVLRKTDIAVVVTEAGETLGEVEKALLSDFEKRGIPSLLVRNKADLLEDEASGVRADLLGDEAGSGSRADLLGDGSGSGDKADLLGDALESGENADMSYAGMSFTDEGSAEAFHADVLYVSAKTGWHIQELKERIALMALKGEAERSLIGDLVSEKDTVVLVVPVDAGAPKGRLILPQQQVIRGLLDAGAFSFVCRDTELEEALGKLAFPPKLVITDSQVFDKVNRILPEAVPLTSFSILMARYKGDLRLLAEGAAAAGKLRDGGRVLISEGCTHHRQCEDIGTVKLPNLIRRYTKSEPDFSFTSGGEFPEDVSSYKLVVHCGGCMLNRREMNYRLECCREQGVPVTNYGVLIAYLNRILERTLEVFK